MEADSLEGQELSANPLTLAGYPIKASADQRDLVTATGAPFQYVADTPWALPSQLSQADVSAYLEDRQKKGFNTIQVMLLPLLSQWTKNYYGVTSPTSRRAWTRATASRQPTPWRTPSKPMRRSAT